MGPLGWNMPAGSGHQKRERVGSTCQKDTCGTQQRSQKGLVGRHRKAHGDAGSRVQVRCEGAWATAGQSFTVYKAHLWPLSHLIKPGWTAHPSSPPPLPTGLPTGWGTHQGHSDYISIPKHALEAAKSRRAGGAQMREKSHDWVWSGRASWRRSSGGYPG